MRCTLMFFVVWNFLLYYVIFFFFFFNDTATTEIYTLSLHDALPISFPNGVRLSADGAFLIVDDSASRWVWSFQIQPDGSLSQGDSFYRLEMPDETSATGADGMTVDSEGWLYVATKIGIQVLDTQGRVVAILNKPQPGSLSNLVFGGPNRDVLYATAGDKVFRRPMRRKGLAN